MLRGLYPWWHWLLERENPRTLRGKPDNRTGANLEPEQFKNSRKMLSLQQGGYMTLAQFAMISGTTWQHRSWRELLPQRLSAGGVTGSKVKTGVRLP